MKKLFLLLIISLFYSFLPAAHNSVFSYLGSFEFLELSCKKRAPSIPVYYKGARIPVEKKSYLFNDPQLFSSFTIIVTLLDKPKANTITHLSVARNQAYLLITITKKIKQFGLKKGEFLQETWDIKKTEGMGPFEIPKDALIILIDPTCIEEIKNVTWARHSFVIKLPTIIFKKDLIQSNSYAHSLFADLDIRSFHKENKIIVTSQTKKSESSRKIIT